MERVMAHRSSPPFSFVAKGDGTVTNIDQDLGLCEITFKDGSKEVISIGNNISSNSGGGFYLNQPMQLNGFEVGQQFKRGDVLAYNPMFFQPDPYTKQVDFKIGTTATVAFIEQNQTLEDSTVISKELSEKMSFSPIAIRDITLSTETTVHQSVKVGDEVRSIDSLMVFDEAATPIDIGGDDPELSDLLHQLNNAMPKAKHSGTIVKIDAFYKGNLSEMNPSVAKIIRSTISDKTKKAKFAKGSSNDYAFPQPGPLENVHRVSNNTLDATTVILRFYIEHKTKLQAGSKLIVGPSLKSVDARVMEHPIVTEDGTPIDVMMSCRSKEARIVFSPDLCGVLIPILEKMETDMLAIIFED